MSFDNRALFEIPILGKNVWITETIFNTWIIMAVLVMFAIIVRISLNNFKKIPSGFQNVIEAFIEAMENFINGTMGEKYSYFGNWFFALFLFILCSNYSGLFGLRPPTADLATTLGFALVTLFLIHFMGIITGKGSYFKDYFGPHPLFFPMNVIGAVAPAVSLSFRLFGNLLGGLIIMGMIYFALPPLLKVGIPAVLHIYFDIFSGFLQAFIFTILSMTFIKDKIVDED